MGFFGVSFGSSFFPVSCRALQARADCVRPSRDPLVYYINSGSLCVRLSDTTILHFNSLAELASAFSMVEPVAMMTRRGAAVSMAELVAVR